MNLNKVFIIGNLTRDPELRTLPSGAAVASFGVATNRVWKNQQGQRQEEVQFHNIVVFGRQAETTNQYLTKGSSVLIEGRINTRSWEGKDGVKNYRTEIIAERVQFGPRSGSRAGGEGSMGSGSGRAASMNKNIRQEDLPQIDINEEEINADDLPF
ncbi:single-stranded DNA-binding protein [Candidatus Wolfebacteria bacterium]|nr:single-stranded DNA-binding protein [Candidatus Wolfebacteria bacterium]